MPNKKPKQPQLIQLPSLPNNHWEQYYWQQGYECVAGLDEAGRGALAGPVVAAAVVFKPGAHFPQINDSKKLTPKVRDELFDFIVSQAEAYAIGIVSSEIIDSINILQASLLAMKNAAEQLKVKSDFLLIDGNQGVPVSIPQKTLVKGDSLSMSIGAASILAKVTRDRLLCEYEKAYPQFKFSVHKGYGTRQHHRELMQYGVLPIHRQTFEPVRLTVLASNKC